MQELHDDFGMDPRENLRLNSTVIDEDENAAENSPMDEDVAVELCPTQSNSFINEKCLLDELLQTDEVSVAAIASACARVVRCSSNARSCSSTSNYARCVWS